MLGCYYHYQFAQHLSIGLVVVLERTYDTEIEEHENVGKLFKAYSLDGVEGRQRGRADNITQNPSGK